MKLSACLKSMRLRTLPLSLSGVVVGICLAQGCSGAVFAWPSAIFLLLTTCCLQVLSNLSNELGDTLNGTDAADRQGMHYAVQDGDMTVAQLKKLIAGVAVACCVCGALMIFFSFGTLLGVLPVAFLLLGACAIVAAMRYTLGRNPYGYRGLGDLFVFIFFGLVSTVGGYFICAHSLDAAVLLPASAIGFFSMGVLNVNNIRDMKSDARTRSTVALKLGLKRARIYQTALIVCGWQMLVAYSIFCVRGWLFLLALPLYVLHLRGIWRREDRALDPMLPLLVMSTFLLALLFGLPRAF